MISKFECKMEEKAEQNLEYAMQLSEGVIIKLFDIGKNNVKK